MAKRIQTLYLAGPESNLPDADEHGQLQAALCQAMGFDLLKADPIEGPDLTEIRAREIYADRVSRMRRADAAVINLTPFRGPTADPAAAFEAGFIAGLGKPVFAWLNVTEEDHGELRDRIASHVGARLESDGAWRDPDGCLIEDFGLPESLMLWAESRRLFVVLTDDPLRDLTGLQLCLEALSAYQD